MINILDQILSHATPLLQSFPQPFSPKGTIGAMLALVYASKFAQVFLSFTLLGKYDNVNSAHRSISTNKSSPWQVQTVARAYAAHANHWEAFTAFSVAVILATQKEVVTKEIVFLCNSFIWVRVIYNIVFILAFNEPLSFIRSSVFAVGMAIIVKLLITGILA